MKPFDRIRWHPDAPCLCGSGRSLRACCLQSDGRLRKTVPSLMPPAPKTGSSTPGCYLAFTDDCSENLSGEHYMSKSVLEALGGVVRVRGAPWIPSGGHRDLHANSLTANILCYRHNHALRPLDAAAGRFFNALRQIHESQRRRSLSRKGLWFLFSGEELELWMLKTLCGMYHAGNALQDGKRIGLAQQVSQRLIEGAFQFGLWGEGCGLYWNVGVGSRFGYDEAVAFAPFTSPSDGLIVGCWLSFAGLDLELVIDPSALGSAQEQEQKAHRPGLLLFENGKRQDGIILTWPPYVPFREIRIKWEASSSKGERR